MHACVLYAPLVALLAVTPVGAGAEQGVPAGKLPRDVVPLHYRLELRIDPAAAGFSGEVRIRVRIAAPTATIWLHARELEIEHASVTPAGAEAVALTAAIVHESGVLKLGAPEALPAGEAELALSFRAPFGSQLDGTYKVSVAERPYVMTQMEPLAARKSFPCFDEPAFKTAWDVTLVVPGAAVAVANTRQRSEAKLPDGWRKVVFETSAPLPTYLIAYAVGPWDVVAWAPIPATQQRATPIPLRGIAVAGHGPELRYALAETARAVSALEAWFDLPYPFDKLDLLAAPDFAAGAMENAGLVVYQERLLLVDDDSPTNLRRAFVVTHLHELAHQWFGNSVTMPWWDDLWLNEALATWLSLKLTAALEPGFEVELHQLEAVRWAMQSDSLASARRIAEPIRDFRDVASAFDGITYVKGAAVLAMFEAYLGAERFQGALRAYVRAHAGGSATSGDLVRALAAASDDPAGFSAAFRSFLDQPGVPFALAGLECREGKPVLAVTQQRFLPLGASASAAAHWGLPLCVAHGREASRTSHCALMAEPAAERALPAGSCTDWLLPNAGAAGYYRFSLAPDDHARLAAAFPGLPPREQWMVVDAMDAAFEAGALTPAEFLAAAQEPASSRSWAVARAPLTRLDWLRDQLAGAEQRPALAAFVRRSYGPRLAALGSEDRAGDDDEARIERQALIQLLARADDPALRHELAAQVRAALAGARLAPERLHPDQRATALWVFAQDGNEADFSALESAFATETDAQLRLDLVRALASALEPQRAARVRVLALAPEVRAGELAALLEAQLGWEPNRAAGRAWFRESTDAVLAKLPAQQAAYAPAIYASGACSEAEADEVETLFAARVAPLEGGPRAMAQLVESIRLCAALRTHHAKSGFGDALAEAERASGDGSTSCYGASGGAMRPWTIDADDIHLANEFDAKLLHKTPWIEDFLDYTRDDKFIVVGTKGFGKTLLLKAKRIAYEDTRLCIPQDSLLDKPVGDKIFRRDMLALYGDSTQPWAKLWLTSIAISVLKRLEMTEGLSVSHRFAGLLADPNLRSVLDHFVNLLDFSRNDLYRCANETDNQLVPRLRAVNRSVAVFIDSVDEYFNKHIKAEPGRGADAGEVSPNIWYLSQMALVEVAYELRRISHHLKVFAAVRKEAFARFAGLTPMIQQYRGSAVEIAYSPASLKEIFVNNVLREKPKNLVARARLQSDPIEAFLGRTQVADSFTGEAEDVFDYIRRHSLLRPRDFMTIGQKLSAIPPDERRLEDRFKAAVHAAAGEIAQEYLKEIEPYLGGVDVPRLLALIPSDVLSRAELKTLIRSYDRGSREDGLSLGARAVHTLFNAGLLGIVQFDASRGAKVQRFLSPGEVSLDQEGSFPSSSHYLVRPVIAEIVARQNAEYAHNVDLSNLIGGDRPWKEPKRAKSGYAVQSLCVLHADIRNFSRLMQDVAVDRGVREAFARSAKANASPCIYFEIVNGDSLWIVHDDPNVLLKAATRIKEDLFEAPGNPELRMAADFGSIQLRRADKKRMSLAGGEAVRRVARIEPQVRVSELWVTEEFKRELEKKPTLYRAVELRPEQSEAGSHFNVKKPDSGEADLLVKLYRIGPKSA